ncbi:hypothetical protein [Nannocystis pusilla]|uniref:Uncharacterized protein n=1 Tax=Nannocystis pusilla TaxID=889268 RepID=A0ABS7TKW6_9BACT|nr:hypothetical protein [Nannocystis pusilla]MBZ5708865.1 hypothetical protein [Nannocystis pusilla]
MLSPTLALRCPHCQHALGLADIRGAATCPACGQDHGLPAAVADALALYERAIQQAVSDLVRSAPVPTVSPEPDPEPADLAPPQPRAYAPSQPGPSARLLGAPVHPTTLLAIGPAPAPPVPGPAGPAPKDSYEPMPGETMRAPLPARPGPATLSGQLAARPPVPGHKPGSLAAELAAGLVAEGLAAEPAPAGVFAHLSPPDGSPVLADSPSSPVPAASLDRPVRADIPHVPADRLSDVPLAPAFDPAALSGPLPAPHSPVLSTSPVGAGDTIPGAGPSNSSLLAILYNRAGASQSTPSSAAGLAAPPGGLAEAPLLVAAVREPADGPPVRTTSELVAAVRSFLPDRPDAAGPEPEGRIPATALAVARRALLARHADERRQQQVRDGGSGLLLTAVVCVVLVVFGLWYVAAPIALLAVLLRLRREERGERFGAEVQRLGEALGGQRLPSYDAIVAWFDGLWPAPVSPEAMWTSHLHGAVRCHVHGYAALVDVHLNEKTAGGVLYPPRITAYLAAVWPGRVPTLRPSATDLSPEAQARLTRLRRAGYTVVADGHGGLIMRASESIAQAARADITRLPALQVPIGELADLARDLGAEPVVAP